MDATALDLDRLERNAWRKFYGDGLFDIYLGGMLAILPLAGPLEDAWGSWGLIAVLAFYLVLLAGYGLLRHYVTKPRLGSFKPAPSRRRKIGFTRLILAASVIVGLFAMWLVTNGPNPAVAVSWIPVAWFLNCVLVFSAMAYFLDVPRFYVYGFVFGSTVMLDELAYSALALDLSPFVVFGLPGLGIMAWGVRMFVRFVRDYPVISAEEPAR